MLPECGVVLEFFFQCISVSCHCRRQKCPGISFPQRLDVRSELALSGLMPYSAGRSQSFMLVSKGRGDMSTLSSHTSGFFGVPSLAWQYVTTASLLLVPFFPARITALLSLIFYIFLFTVLGPQKGRILPYDVEKQKQMRFHCRIKKDIVVCV